MLEPETPSVITGDFNVAPADDNLAPGALSPGDALIRPESRARLRRPHGDKLGRSRPWQGHQAWVQ